MSAHGDVANNCHAVLRGFRTTTNECIVLNAPQPLQQVDAQRFGSMTTTLMPPPLPANPVYLPAHRRPDPRPDLVFAAMRIMVQQTRDTRTWYMHSKELELVSMDFCHIFRGFPVAEGVLKHELDLDLVRIDESEDFGSYQVALQQQREPRLADLPSKSAFKVTWCIFGSRVQDLNDFGEHLWGTKILIVKYLWGNMEDLNLPDGVMDLHFGGDFCSPIDGLKWPLSIENLSFGGMWDSPLEGINLPSSLRVFRVESIFDHPVQLIVWPDTLEEITLGGPCFDQPIEAVRWPRQLQKLALGDGFNHALTGMYWPEGLRSVQVGSQFAQTLAGIVWPPALQCLSLGANWDESLEGVVFPESLKKVRFGDCFNDPLIYPEWGGVTDISFGREFNMKVNTGCLPKALVRIQFGDLFEQDISGVKWPPTLVEMQFGKGFEAFVPTLLGSTQWPDSLQRIVLGGTFSGKLDGVAWPPDLKSLAIGDWFNHSVEEVRWPLNLRDLSFGLRFKNHLLSRVTWPPGLVELTLKGVCMVRSDALTCKWPSTLQRVKFSGDNWLTRTGGVLLPVMR